MKITILVNHDLPALLALNYLLPNLREHQVAVHYTQKASAHDLPGPLQKLAEFERESLNKLDKSQNQRELRSFKQLGQYTSGDITKLNSVNHGDFEKLQQFRPDLIVSIRHMTILHEKVISLPKLGVINLHSGLLPRYQGIMSTFRAMVAQEPILGSTLHYIEDRSIDSGAVIARTQVATRTDKSYFWNVLSLYKDGCQLILNAIALLRSNKPLQLNPQEGLARYHSYPNEDELIEFSDHGFTLFEIDDLSDFQLNATEY